MTTRIGGYAAAIIVWGLLSACGQDDRIETLAPLAVPFESTIIDSLVAATVTYEGRVDTFSASQFTENLDRLNALFPEVMEDEARSWPIRQEIVRQYVLERLMMTEASKRGLGPDSALVQAEIARFRSQFATEEDYLAELGEIHQTEDDLKAQFRATITREALVQSVEDSLQKPLRDEVEAFQEEMSIRLRVQHILLGVSESQSDEALESSRERALQMLDSLESGKAFAALARRFSDDPGSKVSGGELPWFRKGEMVQEFERAAFALREQGDYTRKPVQTPYGYHVIRLLERRRDEVITSDSARTMLTKRLVRAAHEDLQRRLVEQATVRTNPDFIPAPPAIQDGGG